MLESFSMKHKMMGSRVISFFFFKQKTAYEVRNCDWSSDVCSSDLGNNCLEGYLLRIVFFQDGIFGV